MPKRPPTHRKDRIEGNCVEPAGTLLTHLCCPFLTLYPTHLSMLSLSTQNDYQTVTTAKSRGSFRKPSFQISEFTSTKQSIYLSLHQYTFLVHHRRYVLMASEKSFNFLHIFIVTAELLPSFVIFGWFCGNDYFVDFSLSSLFQVSFFVFNRFIFMCFWISVLDFCSAFLNRPLILSNLWSYDCFSFSRSTYRIVRVWVEVSPFCSLDWGFGSFFHRLWEFLSEFALTSAIKRLLFFFIGFAVFFPLSFHVQNFKIL